MNISDFDYDLPDERIAKFPAGERDSSKLLVWRGGNISESVFGNIGSVLPTGSLLVFNNTRVVRARLVMHKPAPAGAVTPGARVEILCLEPSDPADYERAFAAQGACEWSCMVGNLKKWKSGPLEIPFIYNGKEHKLSAWRGLDVIARHEQIVRFEWNADLSFGQLLELLGRVPIPPYLGREGAEIDDTRYQTVYASVEGSVAAPTAGLHFTPELLAKLNYRSPESDEFFVKSAAMQRSRKIGEGSLLSVNDRANFERKEAESCFSRKIEFDEVTLHVGAGTFLPVKTENALDHPMHTEHFEVTLSTIEHLLGKHGNIIAVGTTSVRTLESLPAFGWRVRREGDPHTERPVGQFELYDIPEDFDGVAALETLAAWMRTSGIDRLKASTRIMITPAGFCFRVTGGIVTNFHQPKSTLLLLIAAFTGGNEWRRIYDYALAHGFRFLSYGDSSLLLR